MLRKNLLVGVGALCLATFGYIEYVACVPHAQPLDKFLVEGGDGIIGAATTSALIHSINVLVEEKNGGYQSSGILSKIGLQDDVVSWEHGVRYADMDFAQALQMFFSKQNVNANGDPVLKETVGYLSYQPDSYFLPSSASQYKKTMKGVMDYQKRLLDKNEFNAQFVARAGTLTPWLKMVVARLEGYNSSLMMAVGSVDVGTDTAGERGGKDSKADGWKQGVAIKKTPWLEIDNVFWESYGYCEALIEQLEAIEVDFAETLKDKNNLPTLKQVIVDLKATQKSVDSFMVLNGSSRESYGFAANYSLVMASSVGSASRNVTSLIKSLNND
ncbi:DUF2333 family protein [Photobacterium damselae]|uniref:DUF2333 family protein n=1 Tax=Photobacterium damselae TaxID=38293 RepID=UPI001F3D1C5E|nr:DUF2333 family protein [Photobacterium damselae]UKA04889.1 DUF2333 family protein [Photobacterium damselae subsp. damselae]